MRLVVFTDLDGTLLDHDSYSYAPAQPALDRLRALDVPLVLATSKTAAEVAPLHDALGLTAPAIVENGAGLYRPGEAAFDDTPYRRLRATLDALAVPEFRGFGDLTDADVARITGLPLENAHLARRRCHSEPGLWSGDEQGQAAFVARLAEHGIAARHGGRFLTLSFGQTKAMAMETLTREMGATRTIALGDAPNDAEMIEAATHGVIIRNDHGTPLPPLPGEAEGRIQRTILPGPSGWNAAVLGILEGG